MKLLREAPSGWSVVAVDYTVSGRTIGSFQELAQLLNQPLRSFRVTTTFSAGTGLKSVQDWGAQIVESGHHVDAVLGFCTGAVYAGSLVSQLATTQAPPRLLLIDPEDASDQQLRQQFAHVVTGKLSTALDEATEAQLIATAAKRDATGSALATEVGELLTETALPRLADLGFGPRAAADLLHAITGYFSYLGGAVELPARAHWHSAVGINSSSEHTGLDTLPAGEQETAVATLHRLPIAYGDILRSPQTASLVDQWLAEVAAVGGR